MKLTALALATTLAISLPAAPVSAQSAEVAGAEAGWTAWVVPLVVIGAIIAAGGNSGRTPTAR